MHYFDLVIHIDGDEVLTQHYATRLGLSVAVANIHGALKPSMSNATDAWRELVRRTPEIVSKEEVLLQEAISKLRVVKDSAMEAMKILEGRDELL